MSILEEYARVTKRRPCAVCGRPDWCLIHKDGVRVICARTTSARRMGDAGWLHRIDADHAEPMHFAPTKQTVGIDIAGMARRFEQALTIQGMTRFAEELGVTPVSLDMLRMGFSQGDWAFSFPMLDHGGNVVGIRLRNRQGEKWSVRGGKEGLFYSPLTIQQDTLYIVEGPTDTAAMLDMGVAAVGRPSCTGGVEHLTRLIKARHNIVIVADHDGPGVQGAEALADQCVGVCRSVRLIEPLKGKDVRAWKQMGMSKDALRRVVMNSATWAKRSPGSSSASPSTSAATAAGATASSG